MATGGEDSSSEDANCSLCFEFLSDPFSLSCYHSFCKRCVGQLDRKRQYGVRGVFCPMCRHFSDEKQIRPNHMMRNLIEAFMKKTKLEQGSSGGNNCVLCDSDHITSYCVNCQEKFCDRCRERHLKLRACRDHKVVPIQDAQDQNVTLACLKHPDQNIQICCIPCNQAICLKCKAEEHDVHKTESVQSALQRILPQVKKTVQNVREKMELTKTSLEVMGQQMELTEQRKQKARQQVFQEEEIKIKRIKSDTKKLLDSIDAVVCEHGGNVKQREITQNELEFKYSSQSSVVSWAEEIATKAEGPGLLYELLGGLWQTLRTHAEDSPGEPLSLNIPNIAFKATPLKAENQVGTINVQSNQEQVIQCDVPKEPFYGQITQHVSSLNSGHDYDDAGCHLISFRVTDVDLQALNANNIKEVEKFKLKHACHRMCYFDNRFYCPHDTGGIDVYAKDGSFQFSSNRFKGNIIWALHPLDNEQLLAATQNGLYMSNKSITTVTLLQEGRYTDVYVRGSNTAVLKYDVSDKTNTIIIFNKTIPLQKRVSFDVDVKSCYLVMHADVIYLSSKDCIIGYNFRGEVIAKYGAHVKGENSPARNFNISKPCVVDGEGSLLVTDCCKRRLLVMDSHGRWKVLTTHVFFSDDVVIIDDRKLYVISSSWNIVKYNICT